MYNTHKEFSPPYTHPELTRASAETANNQKQTWDFHVEAAAARESESVEGMRRRRLGDLRGQSRRLQARTKEIAPGTLARCQGHVRKSNYPR